MKQIFKIETMSFVAVIFLILAGQCFAFDANEFKKYFPDQLGKFKANGPVDVEQIEKGQGYFYRAQRAYNSDNGAMCMLGFVRGATVPSTIIATFSKGKKTKIRKYDAVEIPPGNSIVAASVKISEDFLITAIVFNSEDIKLPVGILSGLELEKISSLKPHTETSEKQSTNAPELFPPFKSELTGKNEVRIQNPSSFVVWVGLRSGSSGKDFQASLNGSTSVYVPNGDYKIYFYYPTDAESLYQGDNFTLNNNGIEIQIVSVVGGNYDIKKVQ